MHPSPPAYKLVLVQSYITLFQSSPVERANKNKNEFRNVPKFLSSLITSPSFTLPKAKFPRIANMKNISTSNKKTFSNDGIEN